jgi:hypothetical protein
MQNSQQATQNEKIIKNGPANTSQNFTGGKHKRWL